MKNPHCPNSLEKGFTLLELMVVMGIIALIATATSVTFGNFARTQNINIAFDNVQSALAEAKSKSQSQVVVNCDESTGILVGYEVDFDIASSQYSLEEVCNEDPANPPVEYLIKTTRLPSGIVFDSGTSSSIRFLVLTGGSSGGGIVNITNDEGEISQSIEVSTSGVISELE